VTFLCQRIAWLVDTSTGAVEALQEAIPMRLLAADGRAVRRAQRLPVVTVAAAETLGGRPPQNSTHVVILIPRRRPCSALTVLRFRRPSIFFDAVRFSDHVFVLWTFSVLVHVGQLLARADILHAQRKVHPFGHGRKRLSARASKLTSARPAA